MHRSSTTLEDGEHYATKSLGIKEIELDGANSIKFKVGFIYKVYYTFHVVI